MNLKTVAILVMFTAFVSAMFIAYNPNLATDLTDDYYTGEVFLPEGNHHDFKSFSINEFNRKHYNLSFKSK